MFSKIKLFFAALFVLFTFALTPSVSSEVKSADTKTTFKKTTYTYQRVLIGDQWWMYVYDEDGTLVDVYPIYE